MLQKLLIAAVLAFATVGAQAKDSYTIGIKSAAPFSYQEDGEWKGYSVELIEELSKTLDFDYTFVESPDIANLIDSTRSNNVDLSIAAITTNVDRERIIDFSHPYFSTSIGVLTADKTAWYETAAWIGKRLLVVLVIFIAILYIIGTLADKIDGDATIHNPHEGAWWALVTFTTTGYGDLVPTTPRGKLFASVWMVASLFLLSTFTGYVASAMTVKKLTDVPVTIGDLYDVQVVTVKGSTSQKLLDSLSIRYRPVDSLDEALSYVDENKAKAVVYDKAMLESASKDRDGFAIWSIGRGSENYAIAFPQGSQLIEKFNVGILGVTSSSEWKAISLKYFNE